jgi:hypothetical protein
MPRDKCAQAGVPVPLKAEEPAGCRRYRGKDDGIQRRQGFLRGQNAVDLVTCGTGRNACATEKQKSKEPAGCRRYKGQKAKQHRRFVRRGGLLFLSLL